MKNKIFLLTLFCLLVFPFVSANTIYVNSTSNYTTIQSAINNASDGDTIIVGNGTYYENQTIINKSISVIGEGADNTTIEGGDALLTSTGLVRITASGDVTFKGFTIKNAGGQSNGEDYGDDKTNVGIYAQSDSSSAVYTISNNKIVGTNDPNDEEDYGFYSNSGKEKLIFTNNTIIKTGANAILLELHTGGVEISYNDLDAGAYGIDSIFAMTYGGIDINSLYNISNNHFDMGTGSQFVTGATAISISSSFPSAVGEGKFTNVLIEKNIMENLKNNRRGIGLWNGNVGDGNAGIITATISNNIIIGENADSSRGISLLGKTLNVAIINNTIENVKKGIWSSNWSSNFSIGTHINYNSFIDNDLSIDWGGTSTLNAEYNWWGSCQGPSAGNISGFVDFTPWLGACITGKISEPICLLEGENVTLYTNVSSNVCVGKVTFSVNANGTWLNYTGIQTTGSGNYSYKLNSNLINNTLVEWTVYAEDCYNHTTLDGIINFYVYPHTTLTTIPSEPNGKNGWYVTEPQFTLFNPNASSIDYRWNGGTTLVYSTSFGLENAPNNAETDGTEIYLYYWSNVCGEETEQEKEILVDLWNPIIRNFNPANKSKVNSVEKISIYIDNRIGEQSSGINKTSIIMKINNTIVPVHIIEKSGLDLLVEYSPINLSDGLYLMYINATDNAGRYSEASWTFEVEEVGSFYLNVYLPNETLYSERRIPLNLSVSENVKEIKYIDYETSRPTWKTLCRNCNEYGFLTERIKSFTEGEHNLTIQAVDEFGNFKEVMNLSFFIDSIAPKIYTTGPRANSFTNGSSFYVKFAENNLKKVELIIDRTHVYPVNISKCTYDGRYYECYVNATLDYFEEQEVEYWFNISDFVRTISSKKTKVKVDSLAPIIEVISPKNDESYVRKVPFLIEVNEDNLDSVSYVYNYSGREKEVLLCSRLYHNICKTTKSFIPGNYTLDIKAEDKAGNVNEIITREFEVK